MSYQTTKITHAGMPKPLAVEIRPSDNGIQLVVSLSEALLDEITGAVKFVNYDHHELHEGNRFYVKGWQDVTGAGTNLDFLFVTPDTLKWAHAIWVLAGEAEYTMNLYEGTVTSNNGTPVAIFNHNRNSSKTPGIQAFSAPTVTGLGTLIWTAKIGSMKDATEERQKTGEMIARQNTKYLFRLTKAAAGTEWVDYDFDWYEHTSEE